MDEKFKANFERDFLFTLRNDANYKGPVYVIYYGSDCDFMQRITEKYGVSVISYDTKYAIYEQRNNDVLRLIRELPKSIENIMYIKGRDAWFQAPLDEIFDQTKDSYGFIETVTETGSDHDFCSICKIKNQENFLEKMRGSRLIHTGMIAGQRKKIQAIFKSVSRLAKNTNRDFHYSETAILNFIIKSDGTGIRLPIKFYFPLAIFSNNFYAREGTLIETKNNAPINIVCNSNGVIKFFEERQTIARQVPRMAEELPGSFWAITTFFNPCGYKNKLENYKKFRESSKKQGLKLLAIEVVFGNKPFELAEDDADILVQRKASSILWQRERMLNVALKYLPEDCDKIAWIDNDIIFTNENWINDTCNLLQSYAVIQPFQYSIRMPKGVDFMLADKTDFYWHVDQDGYKTSCMAYRMSQLPISSLKNDSSFYGHTGFCWAFRRKIIQECGFLDKVMPAADMLMARAFYGYDGEICNDEVDCYTINNYGKVFFLEWLSKIREKVKGSVYFCEGAVLHLWHGDQRDRNHFVLMKALKENNFDPSEDMEIDSQGCWAWSSEKELLHKSVEDYFFLRNEEGKKNIEPTNVQVSAPKKPLLKDIFVRALKSTNKRFDQFLGLIGMFLRRYFPKVFKKVKKAELALRHHFKNIS